MIPRNVRDNDPGNLCKGALWRGLKLEKDMTPEQKAEDRFCVFDTPVYGFRALVVLLRNYNVIYQCDTVSDIVEKFAPPVENKTDAYIADVAKECGVDPTQHLPTLSRDLMFKLARAITRHETGSFEPYWNADDLNLAIGMTGYYPTDQASV